MYFKSQYIFLLKIHWIKLICVAHNNEMPFFARLIISYSVNLKFFLVSNIPPPQWNHHVLTLIDQNVRLTIVINKNVNKTVNGDRISSHYQNHKPKTEALGGLSNFKWKQKKKKKEWSHLSLEAEKDFFQLTLNDAIHGTGIKGHDKQTLIDNCSCSNFGKNLWCVLVNFWCHF